MGKEEEHQSHATDAPTNSAGEKDSYRLLEKGETSRNCGRTGGRTLGCGGICGGAKMQITKQFQDSERESVK